MRSAPSLQTTILFSVLTTQTPIGSISRMLRAMPDWSKADKDGRTSKGPDLCFIGGKSLRLQPRKAWFLEEPSIFQGNSLIALSGAAGGTKVPYARTGHTIIFFREQFWGRAARASWTRQEFQDARYFWLQKLRVIPTARTDPSTLLAPECVPSWRLPGLFWLPWASGRVWYRGQTI